MTENIEQQSNWRTKQKALQQLTLLNLSICTLLFLANGLVSWLRLLLSYVFSERLSQLLTDIHLRITKRSVYFLTKRKLLKKYFMVGWHWQQLLDWSLFIFLLVMLQQCFVLQWLHHSSQRHSLLILIIH